MEIFYIVSSLTKGFKINISNFFIRNLLPVTLGNMVGGMLFISIPLYILHKDKLYKDPTHREYLKIEKENKEIIEKELHHSVEDV